ncbi:hypothetical protein CHS0354_023054 [Potamilus streckersoni]|uniref:Anaphase-promoting complex subunit 1 n=1 Tax=Potamilus streckersoni TaxID=2493646 RepID=A0AAE0RWU2_9BIVA|nr:hypothetical protein CHS0354_023054 [Potamilus streckersoni]
MISACDTQDFVPFGRGFIRQHPGKFQLQVQNTLQTDHGLPLLKSFRDISIQETIKQKEQWIFRSLTVGGDSYDEELYISGHTVIWSRGGQDGARSIVKTFTMDSPVLQAVWSSFVIPESDAQGTSLDLPGETQRGVCIIESSVVSCFLQDGGEYTSALPFTVSHAWVIKNGLLFERTVSPSEITSRNRNAPNQTMIFSMLHPLDEVAPVITRTVTAGGPKIAYMTDNTQHIVFCSLEPSIVLTYDTMVGMHSVWRVRRARGEECSVVSSSWDTTASLCQMGPGTPGAGLNQSSNSYSYSRLLSSISGQSTSASPLRSYSGRISSPLNLMSRSQSPLVAGVAQPSMDRRSHSPSLNMGSLHRFHSPSPHANRSPGNYWRTPPVGVHNVSLINESFCERFEPINPEVCFDHLWTEPAPAIRDGSLGKSSKAFLAKDLCGQQFLCYVISYKQQLKCVKFEESNDRSQLIFGAVAVIPAKDAVPIESLDLMLVLDTLGWLFVYSGTIKLNRIHVPTLPLGSGSLSMLKLTTPINSPTRGGVFTSSRPPSAMDTRFDEEFQLNQISPVPTELEESARFEDFLMSSNFIQGLRDNVGCKFTIELVNGSLCRSGLPPLTSLPGIDLCLKAMKHLIPKDLALHMIGKWYTLRNIPGSIGNQLEWTLFNRCLLTMMGYDVSRLAFTAGKADGDTSMSPVQSAKKSKPSDQGSEEDWEKMLNSQHHKMSSSCMEGFLGLASNDDVLDSINYSKPCSINSTAMLFTHIPSAFMALHLVYEEMKLNTLLLDEMEQLVPLLFHLASDLKCDLYMDYYQRDFPHLFHAVDDVHQVTPEDLQKMQYPQVFSRKVPSVQDWLIRSLEGRENGSVLYIPNVCTNIQNIVSLYALLLNKHMSREQAIEKCLRKLAPAGHRAPTVDLSMSRSFCRSSPTENSVERMVLFMIEQGMTDKELTTLPVGVALPIREAIFHCRCNPPSDWPMEAYALIGRQDISQLLENEKPRGVATPLGSFTQKLYPRACNKKDEDDGMENLDDELLKLRFSEDLRVQEARRLLQSAHPARIALTQRPEVGDHEFIEEQEKHLYSICIRTMALPVGRGMFTLSTHHPIPTETFPIPKLCLTGRAPPRNNTVDLTHIDTPTNMSAWPHFHNGVAAGLRIANFSEVDSTWIIYNKPKTAELTNEYPGFLMALGLNKHLVNLNILNVHDYLSKGHEMTTIGLLLGLAAAKRGTMDFATTKILSIHVPALLPPTSTELSVAHNIQVSAVMGIGLVYQGTGHRHTAEVLLSEIGRPPGPEMENCTDRESYSLAAGLALGLVMFGKGAETVGTSDHSMADTLSHFMIGGHKRPLTGPARERYRTPSFQIKEGDSVNVDVTSPGATLALGMLYFNTSNSSVSEWLQVPDSQFMLDQVRPDFLMLRTLSRGLVMWDQVMPTFDYIKSNIPEILIKYAFQKKEGEDADNSIDYETMSQAYCNVIAGASMVIGLKFAGTANQMAFNTLMDCMKRSLRIISTPCLVEQAGKSTVEACMINILLAMAMVMAGTGNLDVLRICRMFRSRVGPPYNLYVMYGSHMAISMAIGLLFLGGGRYTLSTKPEAIGVLLCAFFPKFPIHSNDNRYHLQAFRHLYVLAAESRIMLPRDVDTGYACYVPLEIRYKDTKDYKNVSYETSAPCILPDLDLIEEIKILGPRYWPIIFHVDKNWNTLRLLLHHNGTLYVKQRAGHLSYMEDPKGYRSMLAMSLTAEHFTPRTVKPDVIKSFTSDNKILALMEHFLGKDENKKETLLQLLSAVVYECVTMEKPEIISTHLMLDQIVRRSDLQQASLGITQLKLIFAYYSHAPQELFNKQVTTQPTQPNQRQEQKTSHSKQLLKPEFLISVKNRLERIFDQWEIENQNLLVKYLRGEILKGHDISNLSAYLMWFDIPPPSDLAQITVDGLPTLPVLYSKMPHLKAGCVIKLLTAWQAST